MNRFFSGAVALILAVACAGGEECSPGLVGEYFYVKWLASDFPVIDPGVTPTVKRVDETINFPWIKGEFYGTKLVERFYVRWSGILRVPSNGRYTFFTESDDGSRVIIDGHLVVNNAFLHAMQEEEGEIELTAGEHRIRVDYIQYDGGAGMQLFWKRPDGVREAVPKEVLWHDPAEEKTGVQTSASKDLPLNGRSEIPEPAENATIDMKVESTLPRKEEDRWLEVGWRRNLNAARLESQLRGKPIFLWVMNGNPMGCT